MSNTKRIEELKEELKKYSKKDEGRAKAMQEQREISDLKKQIRKKKYAGVVQTGRNLKVIGKNIVVVSKAVGKGMGKFIGEDPNKKGSKKKVKTVEEVMREMPQ
jgi:hypothetical protein